MKIPPSNLESFAKNPPSDIKAVLIYGPDQGLIASIANNLITAIIGPKQDLFRLDLLDFDQIKSNPASFAEKIGALSFAGGKRVIKITNVPNSLTKEIEEIIEHYLQSSASPCLIVLISDDLPPSSSVRRFFDFGKNIASIACYKDEPQSARKLIAAKLKEYGFNFEPEVVAIVEQAGIGDRLLIYNEVEKLSLYMQGTDSITAVDATACCALPVDTSLEALSLTVADGKFEQSNILLARLVSDGVAAIAIIRSLLRYFTRLHLVKSAMLQEINETEAVKLLAPPLFFKTAPAFMSHLKKWPEAKIMAVIKMLAKCEMICKKSKMPAELLCNALINRITRI